MAPIMQNPVYRERHPIQSEISWEQLFVFHDNKRNF